MLEASWFRRSAGHSVDHIGGHEPLEECRRLRSQTRQKRFDGLPSHAELLNGGFRRHTPEWVDDFHGERANPEFLSIAAEQTPACETGTLASDIVAVQKKLARAEILILQFPIWWFGMPAILKGWADRGLARGFAYVAGRK
jgi:hypothetical protein